LSELKKQRNFILPRAIELTYTSLSLKHFAQLCGYNGNPYKWDDERRMILKADLDALFFHLYGFEEKEIEHILDSFTILMRAESEKYGEFNSKRLTLSAWNSMKSEFGNAN
jgi:hypothetical protein